MPKTKEQKIRDLEQTKKYLESSIATVFLDYSGIPVNSLNELRQKLAEIGAKIIVTKNTILQKANQGLKLEGQTAVLYGFDKIVEPIKILYDFKKAHENKPEIKLGLIEKTIVTKEDIEQISKIPSVQELHAKLVSSLQAPIYKFVTTSSEVYSSFVRVVNAYKDSKQS